MTILFLCLLHHSIFGQVVTARLERDSMRIGEHNKITLTFKDKFDRIPANLAFPEIENKEELKIESLGASPLQKEDIVGTDSVLFTRSYDIIVFDSGYYAIPPLKVRWNDTLKKSNPLLLYVATVPVDTSKTFKDIKPIYSAHYSFADRIEALKKWTQDHWLLLSISGAAVITIITLLILLLRKNNRQVEYVVKRPAHELAFERLQQLEEKDLWKHGKEKAYYSELTDILRKYLEERYNVRAMELTTSQIKSEFRWVDISDAQKKEMITLLQLADLVKFAKEKPIYTDNESSINRVRKFVEDTKDKDDNTDNNEANKNQS